MMNTTERKFLLAVERGNLSTVSQLLESNDPDLDINCCDPLARNALIIAIDNENLPMLKTLVEAGIRIEDALLYAIDENFVEAVELLLDHEEATYNQGELHSWEQDRENSPYSADMTPLILAAHRNNCEIIKILLDRKVSPIPDPHDPTCHCNGCCFARADDCLKHSRSRINAYMALASPCLMALSSSDPLLTAFEMSSKLESLAKMEPEYKQVYMRLRAQCQTFATKLLDYTRTSKELEVLLNYSDDYEDDLEGSSNTITDNNRDNLYGRAPRQSSSSLDSVTGRYESYKSHMRLARLRYAIQCKQKTFCAHPNIQELLATMWYENLPGFRKKNPIAQCLQLIFIGLMFPVYSIAYLVAPDSQLGRFIKKPFIKFICHSASYMTFLVVLILASQRVEAFYSWKSVLSLFDQDKQTNSYILMEGNFSMFKQFRDGSSFDDQQLRTLYKQFGTTQSSNARSFNSLTKMFDQLPASSKKRGTLPSPIELVILVWVISLTWAEVKQLRSLGINYYKADMWNALDSVASGFYIGTIILRIISYLQSDEESVSVAREHWHAYDPILLSEGLFAAATIFSALKLVYIFSINPYLGPLQISLGRMVIDIFSFSWIYMLVLFSFACGMNQLLWYYADLERHQCLNITNYSLAHYYAANEEKSHHQAASGTLNVVVSTANVQKSSVQLVNESLILNKTTTTTTVSPIISQNMSEDKLMEAAFEASLEDDSSKPPVTLDPSCKTWRYFANVFESSQTLFWATFGLVDLENFDLTGIQQYTRFWALLMFGCYCFINVIVVLNLLIAMMNHSYVKISKKSDIEWKFARTRLWMSYFDTGSTVPAPFNIIPSIKSITYFISQLTRFICRTVRSFRKVKRVISINENNHTTNNQLKIYHDINGNRLADPSRSSFCGAQMGDTKRGDFYTQTTNRSYNKPILNLNCLFGDAGRGNIMNSKAKRQRTLRNSNLTKSYRDVMMALVRRYLVSEKRLVERKRALTEAKLDRWARFKGI